uniref:Uncharacterized protein LOC114338051 n=1 Tax=Diabrotica virgifera virgifera TaxID=50390 RepID=A0A6P7GKW0_DIAVI
MTMIDGKMFAVISNSSSQTCGICKASPKIMNDLEKVQRLPVNEDLYDYGISTLHAWIRFLECCLHISYRLELKKWQVRDDNEKKIMKERKNNIIKRLKEELSILVDIPKQGYGTTNDGNTARRFFQNYCQAALITGLDEQFLKRLLTILSTMSSGYEINPEMFAEYCKRTATLYIDLYPWYYMPASLHRILIHGPEIIKVVPLPVGMFSEEALESRNKDFRKFREAYSRKFSREDTMNDVFYRLLLSSDPLISSLSKCIGKISNKHSLDKEVLLLQEPNLSHNDVIDDFDSSDSD